MTTVEVKGRVDAPVSTVWALVSDFTGFVEALGIPYTAEGDGIGMTRTVEFEGATYTERLESVDDATFTTSYSIPDMPLPMRDYRAWISLSAAEEGGTTIRWWGTCRPDGMGEDAAIELLRAVYEKGITDIRGVVDPAAPTGSG